jgi:oligopeptide/dipeptide ABC transporter ATP-binding protein
MNLVEAEGLAKHFRVRRGWRDHAVVRAVDGIDLALPEGGVLGLVGESGSGKSTVARLVLRLIAPTAGQLRFAGRDITRLDDNALQPLRRQMQIIFQNPHSALNPRQTVFASLAEPLVIHDRMRGSALRFRIDELMHEVSLPASFVYRYPHELSGGQKQRVCIARALALKPRLVVLDEPTSALDVSVQAQILEFLGSLRERLGLSYLFISHNLAVVRHLCDRVAIMYLGRIVEEGATDQVFGAAKHPYTKALLASALDPRRRRLFEPPAGDVPNPSDPPSGCRFHPRCPVRLPLCSTIEPSFVRQADGSGVACHLFAPTQFQRDRDEPSYRE